jgi:threonine dehydratase
VPPNDSIEAASKHASDVGHPPAGTFDGLGATAVVNASTRLASVVRLTSLERSYRLSDELGVTVLLKREDQQITRSYKVRGAYNLISSLGATERARGVVCASAGNHAQGLALSCALLKIKGQVFLPANAPRQKRERILAIGGSWVEQVIVGSSYDEASTAARAHAALTGPPF